MPWLDETLGIPDTYRLRKGQNGRRLKRMNLMQDRWLYSLKCELLTRNQSIEPYDTTKAKTNSV